MTAARLYGTDTLALTELQQQRLQACEYNWVRTIARVEREREQKGGGQAETRETKADMG